MGQTNIFLKSVIRKIESRRIPLYELMRTHSMEFTVQPPAGLREISASSFEDKQRSKGIALKIERDKLVRQTYSNILSTHAYFNFLNKNKELSSNTPVAIRQHEHGFTVSEVDTVNFKIGKPLSQEEAVKRLNYVNDEAQTFFSLIPPDNQNKDLYDDPNIRSIAYELFLGDFKSMPVHKSSIPMRQFYSIVMSAILEVMLMEKLTEIWQQNNERPMPLPGTEGYNNFLEGIVGKVKLFK
jgi:hypothetical protein